MDRYGLPQNNLLASTRRHFFSRCAVGLGQIALASLLNDGTFLSAESAKGSDPAVPRRPHFPAKIKSVTLGADYLTSVSLESLKPGVIHPNDKSV